MKYTENEKQKFSIRKLSIGAASVLLGTTFVILGGNSVKADTIGATKADAEQVLQQRQAKADAEQALQQRQTKADAEQALQQHQNKANDSTVSSDVNSLKQESDKAQAAVKAQQDKIQQDKTTYDKQQSLTQNRIVLPNDYVKAVKDFQQAYKDHDGYQSEDEYNTAWNELAGKLQASSQKYLKDIYDHNDSVSDDVPNIHGGVWHDSQYDINRKVDVDHMDDATLQELNEYALRLINDARSQVGQAPMTLNKNMMQMAQEVAKGYVRDNRSGDDKKHHDNKAVDQAADEFGLPHNDETSLAKTTGYGQEFEEMGGFLTSENALAIKKENSTYSLIAGSAPIPNSHVTNMNTFKRGIYNDVLGMIIDDGNKPGYENNWGHTAGLLSLGTDGDESSAPAYYLGLSFSVLPNKKYISVHFIHATNQQIENSNPAAPKHIDLANNVEVSTFEDEVNKTAAAKNELDNDQNVILPELQAAADRAKQAYEQALITNDSKDSNTSNDLNVSLSQSNYNSLPNNEIFNNAEQNLNNESKSKTVANSLEQNEQAKSSNKKKINDEFYILTAKNLSKKYRVNVKNYKRYAVLQGKKGIRLVTLRKHNKGIIISKKKMVPKKKYRVLSLRKVGKRWYARLNLKNKKGNYYWINVRYIKFYKNLKSSN